MKQIIYFFLIFSILSLQSKSQKIDIGIESGLGTFSMNDLKEFNKLAMLNVPFDTKIVEEYPPFFFHRPYIHLRIKDISFGLIYTYQSTGSRISGKDYSGEYRFDMIVNSNSPGISSEVGIYKLFNVSFSISTALGLLYSDLRIKEYLKVKEDVLIKEVYKFRSRNMFFEPGFKFSYPVQFMNIGINAGYLFQIGNKSFYSINKNEAGLINPESGEPVKPGWSGFRAGLSVSYCFPKSSEKPINH